MKARLYKAERPVNRTYPWIVDQVQGGPFAYATWAEALAALWWHVGRNVSKGA